MKKLGIKKMGMYLLHFPYPDTYLECWHELEKAYNDGLVEVIGVCNCGINHLEQIIRNCDIVPFIDQVECHPYLAQVELLDYCKKQAIQMEAYSPFARNLPDMIYNPVLTNLAHSYNKSVQQIILRWNFQRGVITIPKASSINHVVNNANIFNFELSESDMRMIGSLNKGFRIRYNPDTVDYSKL